MAMCRPMFTPRKPAFPRSLAIPLFLCAPAAAAQDVTPALCVDDDPRAICDAEAAGDDENAIVVRGLRAFPGEEAFSVVTLAPVRTERVENTLRDIPGLQQFRRTDARTANPTSQGITLRGLGGNASSRAILLLDGVPQDDPFGGYISWPGYDALALAEARVARGGGTGANGPGAIAGTVELFSERVGDAARVGVAYGSRDSVDADALFARALGGGELTVSANYATGDGFVPIVESQRGAVDRPAAYEQAGLAVRFVAPMSPDTELQAGVRAFTDDRERGFAFSENHNDGADASVRIVNRGADWQWSALGYVQIRNFDVSFGGVSDDRNTVNRVFEQFNVPSTGLGARVEVRPPTGSSIDLRLGGDWRRTEGVTNENFFFADNDTPRRSRRAGGETSTYGLFAEASADLTDALLLTGGARVDFWSIDNGFRREIELIDPAPGTPRSDDRFASRHGTEFTGRAGIAYRLTDGLKLRSAGYLGWRLPTLNELFRPFRVGPDATAANELLEPERVTGVEAGLDYDAGPVRLSATVYYNELRDAVANVTLDRGPGLFPGVGFVSGAGLFRQRQNLEAVVSKGIEAEARFDLAAVAPGLTVTAAYSFVDAEVDADGAARALDGLRPAQVPRHNGFARLGWEADTGAEAAVSLRYTGAQFEDDLNARALDDALTVDARIGVPLSDRFTLEARADNLFDERVEAAIASDGVIERAQPRTLWIGLRAAFE